ncbi:MAG: SpoIIE family protein phosphatase [Flavobacteriales bacterium]|nr:SpoIIE family protein phosphatase [Flavobacteriales bacterium]
MRLILNIWIILLMCAPHPNLAQSVQESDPGQQHEYMLGLLDQATDLIASKKYTEAAPVALEGYRIASGLESKNEIARSSLLLSIIYRNKGNFYEALDFGIRALKTSEGVSDSYKTSSTLALIELFYEWEAWEKVIEYCKLLDKYPGTDANTKAAVNHELFVAYRSLNKSTEAIWVLEDLINQSNDGLKRYYMGELTSFKRRSGDISGALKNESKLRILLEQDGDATDKSICENNLGSLYLDLGEYDLALTHLENALNFKSDQSIGTAEILLNIATTLFKKSQTTRAFAAIELAEGIYSKYPSPKNHSLTLALKARILSSLGDMSNAITTGNDALNVASEIDDPLLHSELYNLMSSLANKSGDQLIASEFKRKSEIQRKEFEKQKKQHNTSSYEKSVAISSKEKLVLMGIAAEEESRLRLRQQLEQSQRDQEMNELKFERELQQAELVNEQTARDKAQRELELVRAALQSEQQIRTIAQLQGEKTAEQLKLTELSHANDERQKEYELLKKENILLESERKLKEIEVEQQASERKLWTVGIGLLVFILGYVLYNLYIMRQKNRLIHLSNINVQMANEQLAGQHEEIISSIHYARNFQDTIIPAEEVFQAQMEKSFLIYQPLDIVSGDIPFIVRKESSLYIGAIDCIGHGVPAAMLSFMAYYNLTEIINEKQDILCGQLLSQLHDRLGESLKKRYSNPNFASGIDIGLCKINLDTNDVEFAGANLPVIIVNDSGCERIKGEMQSVGDIYRNQECPDFPTHSRQLEEQDRIFLLSDGFIHQFGGENGAKKFSMKRLTAIFQQMHHQPMEVLRAKLLEAFEEWKGDTIQTDDIVLIGIELNQPRYHERKRA